MIKPQQHTMANAGLEEPEGELVPWSSSSLVLYGHPRVGAPAYITSQHKLEPRFISHRMPCGSITQPVAFTAILSITLLQ